jgi:hydroxymethylpyrimidine pyrophosphatase-like HAD family hydrolase
MKNGRDEVKAVSGKVSDYTNDEDAVGREIEALIDTGAFE